MFGGAHENERRPGTENVAAIAGMAAAAEWTMRDRESEQERRSSGCAMSYGREFRRTFQMQNRTARTRRGWQTR